MSLICPFSIPASNILLIQFSMCNLFSSTTIRLRKAILSCDVLWLHVSCRGGDFRHGVWAQTHGMMKQGKCSESISVVDCYLLCNPQPRENETLAVLSLPGETESPIRQLLPSLESHESHVPLCLSSPPCLTCPCCVQTVCCSSGLPPNLFLHPVPCFSRSFLLLQTCSLHLLWCSYATSLIFLHSQPHVLIHSPSSPCTRSPLYLH